GAGQFTDLVDLQFGADGNLYALDHGQGSIQVFDKQGKLLRRIDASTVPLSAPNGFAIAKTGDIYVANTAASNVLRIHPDGPTYDTYEGGPHDSEHQLVQPTDVAIDAAGELIVSDLQNRVSRLGPDGNVAEEWPLPLGMPGVGSKFVLIGNRLLLTNPD